MVNALLLGALALLLFGPALWSGAKFVWNKLPSVGSSQNTNNPFADLEKCLTSLFRYVPEAKQQRIREIVLSTPLSEFMQQGG